MWGRYRVTVSWGNYVSSTRLRGSLDMEALRIVSRLKQLEVERPYCSEGNADA